MSHILVLGSGMVGSAMALDLARNHKVTCADLSSGSLGNLRKKNPGITTEVLDVRDHKVLQETLSPFDLVVSAVPGFLGFETLRQIILTGKPVVDISFFPEDALELHATAIKHNATAIVDCGVAPGMDNLILGYHDAQLRITEFECLVGGLPRVKIWPFEYKAPFSPADVIEEYTRPARYVENGHVITKPALSDVEHVQFEKVGTLEAFNSDGLRSIIRTMNHIPNMKEKTLRYPGHVEKIRILRDAGFFGTKPVRVGNVEIAPLDFTSRILFDAWKLGADEEELTVMRVRLVGTGDQGQTEEIVYELYDTYNAETGTSSMARTTGYTATAAVNWMLDSGFSEKGIFPPERIGAHDGCFRYILRYLEERGIHYDTKIRTLNM